MAGISPECKKPASDVLTGFSVFEPI